MLEVELKIECARADVCTVHVCVWCVCERTCSRVCVCLRVRAHEYGRYTLRRALHAPCTAPPVPPHSRRRCSCAHRCGSRADSSAGRRTGRSPTAVATRTCRSRPGRAARRPAGRRRSRASGRRSRPARDTGRRGSCRSRAAARRRACSLRGSCGASRTQRSAAPPSATGRRTWGSWRRGRPRSRARTTRTWRRRRRRRGRSCTTRSRRRPYRGLAGSCSAPGRTSAPARSLPPGRTRTSRSYRRRWTAPFCTSWRTRRRHTGPHPAPATRTHTERSLSSRARSRQRHTAARTGAVGTPAEAGKPGRTWVEHDELVSLPNHLAT